MSQAAIKCPQCQAVLKFSTAPTQPKKIKCPKCGEPFVYNPAEASEKPKAPAKKPAPAKAGPANRLPSSVTQKKAAPTSPTKGPINRLPTQGIKKPTQGPPAAPGKTPVKKGPPAKNQNGTTAKPPPSKGGKAIAESFSKTPLPPTKSPAKKPEHSNGKVSTLSKLPPPKPPVLPPKTLAGKEKAKGSSASGKRLLVMVGGLGGAGLLILGAMWFLFFREPGTATVSGKATFKDPILKGSICFTHVKTNKEARGPLKEDGTFRIEGVPYGEVQVKVYAGNVEPKDMQKINDENTKKWHEEKKKNPNAPPPIRLTPVPIIPLKYSSPNSPLKFTVTKSEDTFNFEILPE